MNHYRYRYNLGAALIIGLIYSTTKHVFLLTVY